MCIAAISREGGFSEDELRAFFLVNQDGGGYAWADGDGKVNIIRHINNIEDYVNTGKKLAIHKNLMTHCRIATVGTRTLENAHPFPLLGYKAALCHNGTFFHHVPGHLQSDTAHIVENAEKLLGEESLMTPEVVKEVQKVVGTYNKIIILYGSGNFVLINEDAGHWSADLKRWYSNTYWQYRANSEKVAREALEKGIIKA